MTEPSLEPTELLDQQDTPTAPPLPPESWPAVVPDDEKTPEQLANEQAPAEQVEEPQL